MEIETVYREERSRALATLIRVLRDFDLAEEMLQEAFTAALEQWPRDGAPANPRAWLVTAARHKAIDRIRREKNFASKQAEIAYLAPSSVAPDLPLEEIFPDDMLRLIFTCCHPALGLESQVALTLKTLCNLTVDEIARAFLVPPPTMAQRLVRAKAKIRTAGIPYAVPAAERLEERLEGVLRVVYLVFNEGYAATSGGALVRGDLCSEAIRLGRLLRLLLPASGEVAGLLGLMLLQDSRRAARVDPQGDIVTLEDQDRSLWNRAQIAEAEPLAEEALRREAGGFYALQAAIAAVHARAPRAAATDWPRIVTLYARLLERFPSPVVALNHAVAVAMGEGLDRGLELIEALEAAGALPAYHLLPAARADILRRLGRAAEAAAMYERALALVTNEAERRYLAGRLASVRPA